MAQIDVLNIFFEGRKEFLRVVRSNESIVKALSDVKNPVCPLIGSDIKFVKRLGKGKTGVVFEINFPDKGKRRYVAKRASVDKTLLLVFLGPAPGYRPKKTFMDIQKTYEISAKVVIDYNGLTAHPNDFVTRDVVVPLFKKSCSLRRKLEIPRFDKSGITTLHPDDQVCETAYTEFVIALLVGELYRSGRSINFLDTFYFATCIQGTDLRDVQQYTFMEKVDSTLRKVLSCITEVDHRGNVNPNYIPEVVECITIQILHAIGIYQEAYHIVHGDLHDDNVFLEYVNEDTIWNEMRVLDADYYHYKVGDKNLFVPGGKACPFIVKMGDWGISCKYSSPKVVETTTIHTGYNQNDGHGAWLPNFYTTAYDPVFIVSILGSLNPTNEFLQNILAWMLGLPKGYTNQNIATAKEKVFNVGTGRPSMKALSSSLAHVSPIAILTNEDLMGKYLDTPAKRQASEKSILFGEIWI